MTIDIDWNKDDVVIVPPRLAIAVYENEDGEIVLRQQADACEEHDHIILIHKTDVSVIVDAILRLKGD